jgi:hypothetical protein
MHQALRSLELPSATWKECRSMGSVKSGANWSRSIGIYRTFPIAGLLGNADVH